MPHKRKKQRTVHKPASPIQEAGGQPRNDIIDVPLLHPREAPRAMLPRRTDSGENE
jgi:hypothetical protein